MYFVYLLECKDASIYTGITTDPKRRLKEHLEGKGGHFTSAKGAVRMLYTEGHLDRSSASKREAEIKGWSRAEKLALIQVKTTERIPDKKVWTKKVWNKKSPRSK
jgi:putative endonuclease